MSMQIMSSGGTFSFRELLLPSDDISDWPAKLFFLELSLKKQKTKKKSIKWLTFRLFVCPLISMADLFDMTNNNLSFDKKKFMRFSTFGAHNLLTKIRKKVVKCLLFLFSFDEKKSRVIQLPLRAYLISFHNKKRSKNADFRQIVRLD